MNVSEHCYIKKNPCKSHLSSLGSNKIEGGMTNYGIQSTNQKALNIADIISHINMGVNLNTRVN